MSDDSPSQPATQEETPATSELKEVSNRIRDRIIRFDRVPRSQLFPHPENPRTHPGAQTDAVRGVLREVGWVDAVLVRELEKDRYQIIDGHLRASLEETKLIPILVLDVDEEEARKILLTFDSITGMAEIDSNNLDKLITELDFDDASLNHMIEGLAEQIDPEELDDISATPGENSDSATATRSKMELRPHEHYDFIVILASDAMTWNELCERLGISEEPLFSRKKTKYGISRAVRAEQVLKLLQDRDTKQETTPAD